MHPTATHIDSVTLYHRGATVRRVATLDLTQPLPAELLIADLPLALLDHSVRVRCEATGGDVVVSNVRVGLYAPPRGTPEPSPDAKELEQLARTLALTKDKIDQLEGELEALAAVPVMPRPAPEEGHAPTPSPMFARASLEAVVEESSAKRVQALRALRDEVKTLTERRDVLIAKQELASTALNVTPNELKKSITVHLTPGAKPTTCRVVLEYFVLGARWAPAYQCRMTRDCRSADLQLRAMVCQRTGEDWAGVKLKLSTAAPLSWTELPELSSIRIGRAQPDVGGKRGFRPPPVGGASLFQDYDRGLTSARAAMPGTSFFQPPPLQLAEVRSLGGPPGAGAAFADSEEESLDDMVMEQERAAPKRSKKMAPPAPPPPPAMAAPAAPMRREAKSVVGSSRGGATTERLKADMSFEASYDEAQADEGGGDDDFFGGASVEVVLYASLQLGAPGDSQRGKLTPIDRRRAFTNSLMRLGFGAPFDVLSVVEQAERQGAALYGIANPPGACDVRTEAGAYDYVYSTDAAVDVPSDGTFHSIPVNTRTATGEVLYVVVPREDTQVYRQALVRNPLPSPLLPGAVEVYVAGEYVLTTQLPSVAPGGDFKLSLGVEQAIKVARNTKFLEERSGDKVVATNELIHDITIELANNLDREANFEVRERLPQPAPEAEVVVEEGKVSPKWEPYTQEDRGHVIEGGRRWVLSVKPGATQTLSAQYRVKLYANNELVGGNRREA